MQPSLHLLYAAPAFRIRYGTNKKIGTRSVVLLVASVLLQQSHGGTTATGIDRRIVRIIRRQRHASPFPSSTQDGLDVDTSRSGEHAQHCTIGKAPRRRRCGSAWRRRASRELGTDGPCKKKMWRHMGGAAERPRMRTCCVGLSWWPRLVLTPPQLSAASLGTFRDPGRACGQKRNTPPRPHRLGTSLTCGPI